ncbi:hypothetical protein [Actinomycetospora soli]|uniref:hypothetical protein n=1 Tax=Actinomycetospora soli TaxID=2893887 RepID=UPI001E382661|nr:hypothetical protein [Actinomycetospora soli]MCD2191629.1 hypothetical protein [Actinomycetospora soli]
MTSGPVDPRAAQRVMVRTVPWRVTDHPVVAEGDIASSEDVWLLRLGGTPELVQAHAVVGGRGGAIAVGASTTRSVDELNFGWASHHGSHTCVLLAFLTGPGIERIDVALTNASPRVLRPIYRHPDPPAAFFLDDFQHVSVHHATGYDHAGEQVATADLSNIDLSGRVRVVGPDNRLEC